MDPQPLFINGSRSRSNMNPTQNCSVCKPRPGQAQHRLSPEPAHLDKISDLPLPFLSQASNIENPRNRCRKDSSLSLSPNDPIIHFAPPSPRYALSLSVLLFSICFYRILLTPTFGVFSTLIRSGFFILLICSPLKTLYDLPFPFVRLFLGLITIHKPTQLDLPYA